MRVGVLAFSILLPVFAAQAQTPGAEPNSNPAAAPATTKEDKVVCRRDDSLGSRLGGKTCLTRKQWAERRSAERGKDAGDRMSREGGFEAQPR